MKLVKLHNENIPPIVLGTWSWGTGAHGGDAVFGNHLTETDLKPVFDVAMDAGFNLWDTAAVYGMNASENILGSFIKGREDVLISTKFTPQMAEDNDNAVEELLDGSLNRLGVDHADIYWIHNPADVKRWTPKLISLMKNGKVKHIGVSNHNLDEIKLASSILAEEGLKISAVQNHYSLLYRSSEEAGIIDYCNENNIVFFSYMVLEQGALTDKYNKKNPLPNGTRRGEAFNPAVLTKIESLIQVMRETGSKHNASTAQIATAWSIAKGTVPIIGVTKTSHIEDAIKSAKINLTVEEILELEEAAKETDVEVRGAWEKSMH
ncbi:aldo/keto reductase [Priestia megaterium]|uniref:aldo/keto reductase n=1 Tax=Priestia megaterium TaxID=1404 RepID=UPI00207ABA68|nr:aldo/keto reductase [Priestia megaterium]USL27470.1 aldo/keto reductase [Priestia megaterium]USL33490.1 aldo/keto reductase [Priestia megaterium]USL39425.1 aldo/keto reductase [Priestia megaterium]WDM31572.1 aldo/keto reductase [Priestia megaterium]